MLFRSDKTYMRRKAGAFSACSPSFSSALHCVELLGPPDSQTDLCIQQAAKQPRLGPEHSDEQNGLGRDSDPPDWERFLPCLREELAPHGGSGTAENGPPASGLRQ